MKRKKYIGFVLFFLILFCHQPYAQKGELDRCNITWSSPSKNASESMPCGGGDIGLNVWVEDGSLYFYMAQSGAFDENNALLKLGRIRLQLSPNPFAETHFSQQLVLQDGAVHINATANNISTQVVIWVDVFRPVIHVSVSGSKPAEAILSYENWHYKDRPSTGKANNANSYKWAPQGPVFTYKDSIYFTENGVAFFHRNKPYTVFDVTVKQQGLDSVKNELFNPLQNLTFGGRIVAQGMQQSGMDTGTYTNTDFTSWKLKSKKPGKTQNIEIYLHNDQAASIEDWKTGLLQTMREAAKASPQAAAKTKEWWKNFWNKSFIYINPNNGNEAAAEWQTGRNYQLFRYMLACNAFGKYPTKFNGGLFTYDPVFTDTSIKATPDFRNWGGGTHTAQNQRLVYYPMLKSGDEDLMKPQFDFYLRCLKNAELRSRTYWNHGGACFTEQLENFGLPNPAEYGWNHPPLFDKGLEFNAWLEYEWDTVLEFCWMMLETERYTGENIQQYLPFIQSCLRFFKEHYEYLAKQRGAKPYDAEGHFILYPGSGAETYKMAYNSTSTITALRTIITRLLQLKDDYLSAENKKEWSDMLRRLPPISFANFEGHKTIAPAKLWERINNTESPQLYTVFPWGVYGVGKPDLDVAINTYQYDTNAVKFRSYIGWKQDNIFAARLGLTDEAAKFTVLKLKDSGRRFPAFWGPGFDWAPDHNWGGSGAIGLQEMLLQTNEKKIFLFPAWPKQWDVHFKLAAPYQTTVEATLKDGQLVQLQVWPKERERDIINMLQKN